MRRGKNKSERRRGLKGIVMLINLNAQFILQ